MVPARAARPYPGCRWLLDVRLATLYCSAGAKKGAMDATGVAGTICLRVLATLAARVRPFVVSALTRQARTLSQASPKLDVRAILQVHLRKLEAYGLVSATVEVSEDRRASSPRSPAGLTPSHA